MSTIPTTSSDLQAANNTQLIDENALAASPAASRTTEVITSSSAATTAAAAEDYGGGGGSTGGGNVNIPDGEVIEFNSTGTSHHHLHQPSETYAWGILAGLSGFTAVISLAFIMGGLLNRDGFQPAWATVCFWSSSLFVFANRQRAHAAAAAVNGLGSALGRAEEPRALDKASRQALLTYFVFNPSEDNEEATPPVVPAESADATSTTPTPGDLEAQVTPVLTYSAEHDTTTNNAEEAGLSTPAGNMERGPSRMGSSKWVTNGTCIICLGEYKSGDLLCRMPCRHVYHTKCIDEWLDRANQPSCPLCKKDLRREVAAVSSATVARPMEGTSLNTAGIGAV